MTCQAPQHQLVHHLSFGFISPSFRSAMNLAWSAFFTFIHLTWPTRPIELKVCFGRVVLGCCSALICTALLSSSAAAATTSTLALRPPPPLFPSFAFIALSHQPVLPTFSFWFLSSSCAHYRARRLRARILFRYLVVRPRQTQHLFDILSALAKCLV